MKMKGQKVLLPMVGVGVAAGAMLMLKAGHKKPKLQKTAGKAIKAVGEVVEHFTL